jgi:RNA polymerase sigma factor (sigma-70 family)
MSTELRGTGQQLKRLFHLGTVSGMTDPQLLEQFVAGNDESAALAFEALVERHGPMVLRVCKMVLHDAHAAEDAFQATFLVLARKARTLRSREHLCNWLYGVAARTAKKTRAIGARQSIRDREAAWHRSISAVETTRDEIEDDVQRVLHEEIERLPRPYRSAVVVCYLEGMSQSQAACQLRLAESTIRGRLARARKLLGQRLVRRGVALAAGLITLDTIASAAADRISGETARATTRFALLFLNRGKAMNGAVSVTAHGIANGVLSTMWVHRLKTIAAIVLTVGFLAAGAALLPASLAETQMQNDSSQVEGFSGIASSEQSEGNDQESSKPADRKAGGKQSIGGQSIDVDPELAKRAGVSIIRAVPVSKDCMNLAYLPDWNYGNVDNLGLANNDGGVRILIDWPVIPVDEATADDRRFVLALYSRKTTSNPPAGPIHAFEILNDWRELTSWRKRPRYDVQPAVTFKFEPGDGWKLFDVTSLIQAQAKAGRKGYGIILRFLSEDFSMQEGDWSGYDFVSREGVDKGADKWAQRHPALLVVKSEAE